ncbi:MAG: hypothetical protein GWO38_27500, partial [Phycisphaerae bacterium]|nr:hypothetical protein [Phycisphaerae bacterium]NIP55102.1 hypothetical protein [Phycisphaerae bacterium]NIX31270.1 hypothetical protein [Phycisphaerae bacterium]
GDVDTAGLDQDHKALADKMLEEGVCTRGDARKAQIIMQLQQMQRQSRNRRELVSSQFENANQKQTQNLNMLASVMKTMNEMQSGIIRNTR